eukprot:SM000159S01753  [mRNA]  locus=s159:29544:34008:+ [translate_table: standard]
MGRQHLPIVGGGAPCSFAGTPGPPPNAGGGRRGTVEQKGARGEGERPPPPAPSARRRRRLLAKPEYALSANWLPARPRRILLCGVSAEMPARPAPPRWRRLKAVGTRPRGDLRTKPCARTPWPRSHGSQGPLRHAALAVREATRQPRGALAPWRQAARVDSTRGAARERAQVPAWRDAGARCRAGPHTRCTSTVCPAARRAPPALRQRQRDAVRKWRPALPPLYRRAGPHFNAAGSPAQWLNALPIYESLRLCDDIFWTAAGYHAAMEVPGIMPVLQKRGRPYIRRLDVVATPRSGGPRLLLDVVLIDASQPGAHTPSVPGWATHHAERKKERHYNDQPRGDHFFPCAMGGIAAATERSGLPSSIAWLCMSMPADVVGQVA